MIRTIERMIVLLIMTAATPHPGFSQSNPHLQTFSRQSVGSTEDQIAAIRKGQAVAKAVPSRTPAEIFLFGAVYIHAAPEACVLFAPDFDRLRKLPGHLGLGVFSSPPELSDLKDFSFDSDDIQALERCKPGDCLIQGPASSIEEFRRSIDWSASNVNVQVNERLRKAALQFLLAYQRDGNQVFGVYNDKQKPVDVTQQFGYMVSYYRALPDHGHGVRAGGSDWSQGINRSSSCRRSFGYESPKRTHDNQECTREWVVFGKNISPGCKECPLPKLEGSVIANSRKG